MPSASTGYGKGYTAARAALLADDPVCHVPRCRRWAAEADHQPPLAQHRHRAGSGCCVLMPMCSVHAREQGGRLGRGAQLARSQLRSRRQTVELAEPTGLGAEEECWRVPWLLDVVEDMPPEAT